MGRGSSTAVQASVIVVGREREETVVARAEDKLGR